VAILKCPADAEGTHNKLGIAAQYSSLSTYLARIPGEQEGML